MELLRAASIGFACIDTVFTGRASRAKAPIGRTLNIDRIRAREKIKIVFIPATLFYSVHAEMKFHR